MDNMANITFSANVRSGQQTIERTPCIRYKSFERVSYDEKIAIVCINTLIAILSLIINMLLGFVIKKTKQYSIIWHLLSAKLISFTPWLV